MYLLYADESGDTGLKGSPTSHFVLSGLVVHELEWNNTLNAVIDFRQQMRNQYGLRLREEIHAQHFLGKPGSLARIPKYKRLEILKRTLEFMANLPNVDVLTIHVDKTTKLAGHYDVFERAWQALIQRFHNTIAHRNFRGPRNPKDLGLLITDQTDEVHLRNILRRSRRYNPVPSMLGPGSRQILLTTLCEDPVPRDSRHSYFLQLCDVAAYFYYQMVAPSSYVRKKGARNYFRILDPVLCKVISYPTPGIVKL